MSYCVLHIIFCTYKVDLEARANVEEEARVRDSVEQSVTRVREPLAAILFLCQLASAQVAHAHAHAHTHARTHTRTYAHSYKHTRVHTFLVLCHSPLHIYVCTHTQNIRGAHVLRSPQPF